MTRSARTRSSVCVVALLVAWSTHARAQSADLGGLAGLEAVDPDTPLVIEANSASYDTVNQTAAVSGNVEAFYGTRALGADELSYDAASGEVRASGNVALRNDDGTVLFADEVALGTDLSEGTIDAPRVLTGAGGRLAATSGQRVGSRYTELSQAVYSPCDVCVDDPDPLWRIRAKRVVHDEETRDIIYEDATFDIEGVSVLYLPYFRHPDPTVNRRTGLLAPEFSRDSTIGETVKIPYFINLAPHRDVTLTPYITSNDGLIMEGEYRARTENGVYRLEGSITNNDARGGGDEWRGALSGEGLFELPYGAVAGYELDLATDDTYLRRYEYSDADRTTSRAFLGKQTANTFMEANLYHFQTYRADEDSANVPQPYPEIRVEHRVMEDPTYGIMTVDADVLHLERESGRDVSRIGGGVSWQRGFVTEPGILLTPFASGRLDGYNVANDPGLGSALEGRSAATVGVDARFPLIRDGEGATHTIEPIMQVVYSPDSGNNSSIPNEDSIDTEFDDTTLFATESRFPGRDRYETGGRLNAGVRYEYQSDDGTNFEATYGRVLRLEDNEDFSANSGLRDVQSDHVTAFRFSLLPYVDLTHRMRLEADDLTIRRQEISAHLSIERLNAEVNYVFLESDPDAGFDLDREEVWGSARFRLDEEWSAYGSARHDLQDSRFVSFGGGLRFENECCSIDLGVKRRFNDDRDANDGTNFGLRVRLKSLGG